MSPATQYGTGCRPEPIGEYRCATRSSRVVVLMAPVRQPVTGDMHGRVVPQRSRKEPHQAHAAQERVDGGAHHLAELAPRSGITAQRAGGRAIQGGHGGSSRSAGDGKARVSTSSSSASPRPVSAEVATTGIKGPAGHRRLQIADQDLRSDFLAAEIPVHQRLVLALRDDPFDQRAACGF